ncbi:DUF1223 domain-containing protein [Dyella halodurans]|uniref:DUF1223 domain-containing protein n=1 Tax=Dyella halodurans TaxID=1920171 RepID=A0ABV9C874_9GAMM|nr:DUF1223 domain-containing protein [Dyella halodurans]
MAMIFSRLHQTLLGAVALLGFSALSQAQDSPSTQRQRLVVVELFQSQGCSSCPPAQANLNAIAGQPDILALSFGVTYWDDLGWKDTFARDAYTQRQWDYARAHKHDNVWTPQIYINGHTDIVGTDRAQLADAIAHANSSGPSIDWKQGQVVVGAGQPSAPCDVWLVRYDPHMLSVRIGAGENSGRTLQHRNVVRELVHLGTWSGAAQAFPLPPAQSSALSTAALVQVPRGGDILSAAKEAVSP